VADLAERHGLGLDVTFFTGHMSGPNWAPRWLLEDGPPVPPPAVRQVVSGGRVVAQGYRNPFHDPVALGAERLLLDTVVGSFREHPAIWMWNLGNEPDLFAWPHTPSAGRAWVADMTARIKALDPDHPVTCGLHVASLLEDNALRVHDVFAETDVAVMHAYPMYLPWARHDLDPDLVPFTCALVSAMTGKPRSWRSGAAAPHRRANPRRSGSGPRTGLRAGSSWPRRRTWLATWRRCCRSSSRSARPARCCGASPTTTPRCGTRPPCDEARHERHFGLVRPDGSLKPHAEAIRRFARTAAGAP
jgi:hypothetical protein